MTDAECIRLSRILNRCLIDLEAIANINLSDDQRQQAMQILSDAVVEAAQCLNATTESTTSM